MKRGGKTLSCLICVIALTLKVKAVVNDAAPAPAPAESETNAGESQSPYNAIWLRNVFDLKPILPPQTNAPPTNAPPSNVDLTGITTILGKKKALFMLQEAQTPGKPAKQPESFIMTEGQRQGSLEVIEINPKGRTVKIRNDGVVSTLSLTNKPTMMAGGPGGPPPGGGPPRPGGFNRQPGMNPPGAPGGFAPGAAPIPIRPVRSNPGNPNYSQVSPQGNYAQPNVQAGYAQPVYGGGYQGGYAPGLQVNAGAAAPGLSLPNAFTQAPSPVNNTPQETVPSEVTAALVAAQLPHFRDIGAPVPPPPPNLQDVLGQSGSQPTQSPGTAPGFQPPPPPLGQRSTGTLH